MSALETFGNAGLEGMRRAIGTWSRNAGPFIFVISFVSAYYILHAPVMLSHLDLGWHLAAGDLIRERGSVPFQDPWSFTLGDRQWFNASWLWDVTASVVFQYTGLGGLVVLAVACGAVIAGCLTAICLRAGASPLAACVAVIGACLLYPCYATPPNIYLAAAPNMATMLFSVIFFAECLKRSRCLWLPLLMLLWVNAHGGFVLGFLIIGVFAGVALLRRDWSSFRNYTIAGAGCFIAIFANPLGWRIYFGVVTTVGHFVQAHITEWMSFFHNMPMPGSIPGILYILAFAALNLRFGSIVAVPLEARILAWLFLFLGVYQYRYISSFYLFSAVVMALYVDRLLPTQLARFNSRKALLAAGIVGACALPPAFAHVRPALAFHPLLSEQDANFLRVNLAHKRLLNHWNTGGLLIFYTRGTVPVFVDGRAATAYPDDLLHDYFRLIQVEIDEATWDAILDKYRIDAVLWVKFHDELRQFLVGKRGWREVHTGAYETVYVRP